MKEFDRFSFPRNYSGKVPLFFRKFPEKFRRKFPEISELTTITTTHSTQFKLRTEEGTDLYLYTKFDADSSVRSKLKRGPKISKLGHVMSATPIYGSVYAKLIYAGRVHPLCVCRVRQHDVHCYFLLLFNCVNC